MCCRLAASIMGTGYPSVRQGPLSPESYPTQPFHIPNLTLPYPQPYLGIGYMGRAWVGVGHWYGVGHWQVRVLQSSGTYGMSRGRVG